MSKSTNRRKSAAIILAVLGVAGLSLASASTLSLSNTNTNIVQAGTAAVTGTCQASVVAVSFDLAGATKGTLATGATFGYPAATDQLKLTQIDPNCVGKKMKVALGTSTGTLVGAEYSATGIAVGVQTLALAGTSPVPAFGALTQAQIDSIKQVSVTIYD